MKKLTLLLTLTATLTAAAAIPAQARTITAQSLVNSIRVNGIQTTKASKINSLQNILKRFGIDITKYNLPSEAPSPAATPAATPAPTAAPAATPKATATPTATATPKATATPAATATPKATATAAPAANTEAAMEAEVLRLVNEERAKQGIAPLKRASDLDALARAHSQDMINRHFFDHNNPDGQSPFDRMRAAGISYRAAAENIAYGQRSAEAVMNAWMNSSGHRKNILNSTYTEIGIGAVKSSGGTIYWTQEFVKR